MGYIAPITPFERMQYANRLQKFDKKNVSALLPTLHTKLYVNDEEWERAMKKKEKMYTKARPKYTVLGVKEHISENIKAEITGKGINFNQVV